MSNNGQIPSERALGQLERKDFVRVKVSAKTLNPEHATDAQRALG